MRLRFRAFPVSSCFALLFGIACTPLARPQFTTARLSGTVVDSSGSAIAGAAVVVNQLGTAYKQSTTTSSPGEYVFPSLPVGTYQITVTMPGFQSLTQRGVVLAVGQSVTVPIRLEVGSVQQNILVTADASLVTTDSPTLGQLISQQEVAQLPLNGRYAQHWSSWSRARRM